MELIGKETLHWKKWCFFAALFIIINIFFFIHKLNEEQLVSI